jgi:HD-like signal output (HDOD) protein
MRGVQAIAKANRQHSALKLGYLIETHTKDLIQLLAKPEMLARVKILLISTDCRGNSVLLLRLLSINKGKGLMPILICEQPDAIPKAHRRGFDHLKIPVWKRGELDGDKWHTLINDYVIPKTAAPPVERLTPDQIRQRIMEDLENMGSLPVLPQVYQRIIQLDTDPHSDIKEWGEAISRDPMSSALVIRRARSSAYGFQGTIKQADRAVVLLGKKETKQLVACDSMQRTFSAVEEQGFSLEAFWLHSVAVGFAAHLLAFPLEKEQWTPAQSLEFTSFGFVKDEIEFLKKVNLAKALGLNYEAQDPFTAGLMHDVGKAAMVQAYPGLYSLFTEYLGERSWRPSMQTAEFQLAGGLTHTSVGEILGRQWGWGDELCEAIQFHHNPDVDQPFAFLVSIADLIGHMLYPFPEDYGGLMKIAFKTPLRTDPVFVPRSQDPVFNRLMAPEQKPDQRQGQHFHHPRTMVNASRMRWRRAMLKNYTIFCQRSFLNSLF